MFFVVVLLSLVGTTLTSSLRRDGHHAPLINCPTCEHHVCDFHNLTQCVFCKIYINHENQPPVAFRCIHTDHCHEYHHNRCCDNEGCVAHYIGQLASSAVTQPVSSVECPRCHGEMCDFINRDQCSTCKIDLLDGKLPHVYCLKETEYCDPNHHICCSDESCIAQAFGHYYLTSNDLISTTESAPSTTTVRTANTSPQTNPTSTGGHQTNQTYQLLNHVPCPVCTHHTCDVTNTNLCEVCQIRFINQLPQGTNCLTVDHNCKDDDDHLCCTDMACVENVFGNIPKSGASLNGNKIHCPECTTYNCNFISCETCVYHGFVHETSLHKFKTCELKGECSHNGAICCHDYPCIDKLFGTHFQTTPTIQSTTNPSITSKTTDRTSTSNAHTLSHATNESTTSTAATTTTTKAQITTPDTTMQTLASSVSSNGQPSSTTLMYTTSTTAPTTPASSSNGTTNSCVDELNNCAMFKSMGVCHASPQEGTKYEISFQCKLTCDRCNETYEPLTTVALTTPTTVGTTQANPTSTDRPDQTNQLNHIPCPVCTHNICDRSNTILCEVCQITFNHQPQPQNAKCLNRGQCFEDDSNLCCTDLACVEIILKHLDAVTNYPLIQPVRAFGHNNQTSQSTISTTKSATSTLPTYSSAAATTTTLQSSSLSSTTTVLTTHTSPRKIHASIKRKTPEESNIGDLLRENGEKKN